LRNDRFPLPTSVPPNGKWEGWIRAVELPEESLSEIGWLGRASLSTGREIESQPTVEAALSRHPVRLEADPRQGQQPGTSRDD
jgi:hypothetical protein